MTPNFNKENVIRGIISREIRPATEAEQAEFVAAEGNELDYAVTWHNGEMVVFFTDDPSDSGGATAWGVTEKTARHAGYTGKMRDMAAVQAYIIYGSLFWDKVGADTLIKLSPAVAEEVVDTGVNCGTGKAGKYLQRCLNVLNNGEKLFDDIAVDGAIGPGTLRALGEYLAKRDEAVLVNALNCLQGAFYIELSERREKDERFTYGWMKNRVTLS